jgi:WD40 repeat protein
MNKTDPHETFLKIETGTHNAVIHSLLVTSEKKRIITGSLDKTIRIWDFEDKKEVQKILGEIGHGKIGEVHTLALSSDDRYLVVAVLWESGRKDGEHIIRIYELDTGRLLKVFNHGGTISSLDFSSDNRFLAVAEIDDRKIHIFEFADLLHNDTPSPYHIISFKFPYQPFAVKILKDGDDYRIISGNWDLHTQRHAMSMYSLQNKTFIKWINIKDRENAPEYFAISDEHIAACGHHERELWILDREFNLLKTIPSVSQPAGLAFSPNGKLLLAGSKSSGENSPYVCTVYNVNNDFSKRTTYLGHDSVVRSVAFIDANTVVTAGGAQHEIHFWNPHNGEVNAKISSVGRSLFSVGAAKDNRSEQAKPKIGFGNRQSYRLDKNNYAPLKRSLDLESFSLDELEESNASGYQRAIAQHEERFLEISTADGINLILRPDHNYLSWGGNWFYAETFGFAQDGSIIAGLRGGQIRVFPQHAGNYDFSNPIYLRGHTADVWDHVVYGDWLITCSADQTIRLWRLSDILQEESEQAFPALNIFVAQDNEWVIWSESGYYTASQYGDRYIGFHVNQGEHQEALFYTSDRFFNELYRPDLIDLILELGSEEKALAHTGRRAPEIGNLLPPVIQLKSQGPISTNKQLFKLNYEVQPANDPIERVWALREDQFIWESDDPSLVDGGDFTALIPLLPGKNHIKIFAESRSAKSSPVEITIDLMKTTPMDTGDDEGEISKELSFSINSLNIDFEITPGNDPIKGVEIHRNNETIWTHTEDLDDLANQFSVPISVESGDNEIKIQARTFSNSTQDLLSFQVNNHQTSKPTTGDLKSRGDSSQASTANTPLETIKPNLYLLSIGVSQYRHQQKNVLENLNWAHKDALDIEKTLITQKDGLYQNVISKHLLNQEATKDNILSALSWLQNEVDKRDKEKHKNRQIARDISVLFLAGHGVGIEGEFYYLCHDADPKNIKTSAVRIMDIGKAITSLPTEVIILTDTCQSGLVGRELIRKLDPDELAKRLHAINERAQFILNATTANLKSYRV